MLKLGAFWPAIGLFAAPSLEGHFLWRVDGERTSYLYGTVHSSDPSVVDIPIQVFEALDASRSFHPELEFSPENIGRMTAAIFAQGTADLEKELPPALWEKLLQNGGRAGIPVALIRRVPVQLAPLLFASPPGADFNKIVDIQVYERAKEMGLAIHELESVGEQVGVFRALSREQAIALLEDALEEFGNGFPTKKEILGLYANGDLVGLQNFVHEEFARLDVPGLGEALIDGRNRLMVKRFLPYLEEGGAFMAVGVGHMPGEKGILALLAQEGYRIAPVPLRETE